jgi:hypothetical protein
MRSGGQAGAQNSQLAAPGKTADNPRTVGFCLNNASSIFRYVGNLTDSFREQVGKWFSRVRGGAMQYDPQTLTVLRNVLRHGAFAG